MHETSCKPVHTGRFVAVTKPVATNCLVCIQASNHPTKMKQNYLFIKENTQRPYWGFRRTREKSFYFMEEGGIGKYFRENKCNFGVHEVIILILGIRGVTRE